MAFKAGDVVRIEVWRSGDDRRANRTGRHGTRAAVALFQGNDSPSQAPFRVRA